MALQDVFKGEGLATGLGVAIGAVVLGPIVLPLVRPLAKGVIKTGLIAYDQGRDLLSDLNDRTGDVMGEARAELDEDRRKREDSSRARGGPARAERRSKPSETGAAPA